MGAPSFAAVPLQSLPPLSCVILLVRFCLGIQISLFLEGLPVMLGEGLALLYYDLIVIWLIIPAMTPFPNMSMFYPRGLGLQHIFQGISIQPITDPPVREQEMPFKGRVKQHRWVSA